MPHIKVWKCLTSVYEQRCKEGIKGPVHHQPWACLAVWFQHRSYFSIIGVCACDRKNKVDTWDPGNWLLPWPWLRWVQCAYPENIDCNGKHVAEGQDIYSWITYLFVIVDVAKFVVIVFEKPLTEVPQFWSLMFGKSLGSPHTSLRISSSWDSP